MLEPGRREVCLRNLVSRGVQARLHAYKINGAMHECVLNCGTVASEYQRLKQRMFHSPLPFAVNSAFHGSVVGNQFTTVSGGFGYKIGRQHVTSASAGRRQESAQVTPTGMPTKKYSVVPFVGFTNPATILLFW